MKRSPLRHTLAVLRQILGLGQKEMAALLECSRPTIQAVELGKLNLSEKLGDRVRRETGVSLQWLLANDVTKPPVDRDGNAYRREEFERIQAHAKFRDEQTTLAFANMGFATAVARVAALYIRSCQRGEWSLCSYKLSSALTELEERFGKPPKYEALGALVGLNISSNNPVDLQPIALRFHKVMKAIVGKMKSEGH